MQTSIRKRNILSRKDFARRMMKYFIYSFFLIFISLFIGILGYHYIADLNWVDSTLNASMILTGMGPVDRLTTDSAKIFASAYSIFSGVAFLSTVAIFFSPIAHRLLHILHVEEEEEPSVN
jgi:TRAP-type C4-dicarboxylate transport system permease small subunit